MLPKIVCYIWKCYYAILLRLIYKTILNLLCYNWYVVIQVGCTNRCLSTYTVFPNVKLSFFLFPRRSSQSLGHPGKQEKKQGRGLWDTNPLLSLLKPSKWLVHIFTIFYSREQMYKAFHVTRNIAPFFQAIFLPRQREERQCTSGGRPGRKQKKQYKN